MSRWPCTATRRDDVPRTGGFQSWEIVSASVAAGKYETRTLSCGGPLWGNSYHLVGGRPFAHTRANHPRLGRRPPADSERRRITVAGGNRPYIARSQRILPGRPTSDRSIEILFPEHVTVVKQGQRSAQQLYLFRPGGRGDRPLWRRSDGSLEYERDLGDGVHLLARATLEGDGVRFHYEVTNESTVAYDIIYAPTDPRLTSIFHDVRLERTYVHHADGFDLLASETPRHSLSGRISGSQLAISCRSRGRSRRSGSSVATTKRTTTSPERSTCPSSPRCPPTRHG